MRMMLGYSEARICRDATSRGSQAVKGKWEKMKEGGMEGRKEQIRRHSSVLFLKRDLR